ncbi:MAG: S24 family peptidase [Treponemataceae bacterium]
MGDLVSFFGKEVKVSHQIELPFAENLDDDLRLCKQIGVPIQYIKKHFAEYYIARVTEASMKTQGIPRGSIILIQLAKKAIHEKIQIVRYKGITMLKKIYKVDNGWELRDGINTPISVQEIDYEVRGDFIMLLEEDEIGYLG